MRARRYEKGAGVRVRSADAANRGEHGMGNPEVAGLDDRGEPKMGMGLREAVRSCDDRASHFSLRWLCAFRARAGRNVWILT
jgi:hypothetical protein